ncbi:MAG: zinc metallopeptidase [Cellulosilyticaceae bacterium]
MSYLGLFLLISIIPVIASAKVQGAFNKYSRVRAVSGYTGEDTARRILTMEGINNVNVRSVGGSMTDHYNPLTKEVFLSQTVYGQNSLSAVSVAAHEVGHAIQDATDYSFLRFRHTLFPITSFASKLSVPIILLGIFTSLSSMTTIGLILFAFTTLFALVTLPVELDASKRAVAALSESGILGPEELKGAKEVLNAAAFTYVAAAATSILMLLRLFLIYGNRNND